MMLRHFALNSDAVIVTIALDIRYYNCQPTAVVVMLHDHLTIVKSDQRSRDSALSALATIRAHLLCHTPDAKERRLAPALLLCP